MKIHGAGPAAFLISTEMRWALSLPASSTARPHCSESPVEKQKQRSGSSEALLPAIDAGNDVATPVRIENDAVLFHPSNRATNRVTQTLALHVLFGPQRIALIEMFFIDVNTLFVVTGL